MPPLASDPRPARDLNVRPPKDSTTEDIPQAVESDGEWNTSQAANQSVCEILQDVNTERNQSISPGDFDRSEKKHQHGTSKRPLFEELPYGSKDDPKASAWGLWGPDDELGTLNYLTPDIVAQASKEIMTGFVIPLKYVYRAMLSVIVLHAHFISLPLDCPLLPMNPRRSPCEHQILAKGYANDDKVSIGSLFCNLHQF